LAQNNLTRSPGERRHWKSSIKSKMKWIGEIDRLIFNFFSFNELHTSCSL